MTYSKTVQQQFNNGMNIIHFPDLTEDERAKRQEQLLKAAERFMKKVEQLKMKGENNG